MLPECNLRVPLSNKNAATPSTRLLPRYQLKFFELKRRSPVAPPPIAPRFVIPGVLVLARPSARDDGTLKTKMSPSFPPRKSRGNPKETAGNPRTPTRQTPDRTASGSV